MVLYSLSHHAVDYGDTKESPNYVDLCAGRLVRGSASQRPRRFHNGKFGRCSVGPWNLDGAIADSFLDGAIADSFLDGAIADSSLDDGMIAGLSPVAGDALVKRGSKDYCLLQVSGGALNISDLMGLMLDTLKNLNEFSDGGVCRLTIARRHMRSRRRPCIPCSMSVTLFMIFTVVLKRMAERTTHTQQS